MAAGPGIVAAKVTRFFLKNVIRFLKILFVLQIQSKGFAKVDAHDNDPNTIRKLKKMGLYSNYICRPITGLYSTGIRAMTYDVIITAGGFRPGCISPTCLNELLRMTKPGKAV